MGFFKRLTRPKAKLSLTTEKHELTLGDELKGIVAVKSDEEFDIEGITVRLSCWESIKKIIGYQRTKTRAHKSDMELSSLNGEDEEEEREYWEKDEVWDQQSLYSGQLQICGEMHVNIGFNKEFPFVIKIPAIGRETYHSVDRNLKWLVRAVMDVKGRRSIRTQYYEILVAKPSALSKEIVREVVLIPCSYCRGLMPQTSTFCPNCGARRRT